MKKIRENNDVAHQGAQIIELVKCFLANRVSYSVGMDPNTITNYFGGIYFNIIQKCI